MASTRLLLADDHGIILDGLKVLLMAQPDLLVVGVAHDGRSAIEQAQALLPDVVIMDISMPDLNGIKATARLTQVAPGIRVLVLSVHEESSYVRMLFDAGAAGYVLKRSVADVLLQAVRAVAAGERYLDPLLAGKVVDGLLRTPPDRRAPGQAELSERETEVLRLVARGYVSREIAAQLGVNSKTVDTYKTRAMEKLGLESRAAIVRYAIQQGWLQEEQP
ncbi:MAG: response regulator transcription factor [Roseiflexaceae bacterium]